MLIQSGRKLNDPVLLAFKNTSLAVESTFPGMIVSPLRTYPLMSQTTAQLAEIVEFLGQLWLYEVTGETLSGMQTEPFSEPYRELGGFIPDSADAAIVENLAIEYCELLVGPKGHVSPVQSVWSDHQYQSKTAASMNRFFELIPDYQPDSNLSDHIGVQLDFLSAILRQSDDSAANEIASHFAKTHLQWTLKFFDKIESHTDSAFYLGLAKVTRNLIHTLPTTTEPNAASM